MDLALGVFLVVFPRSPVIAVGIPEETPGSYAGVLGGVLFGIVLALLLEAHSGSRGIGLGLGGAIMINSCGAFIVAGWLSLGQLALPWQGLILLWGLVELLLGISAVEAAEAWFRFKRGDESA